MKSNMKGLSMVMKRNDVQVTVRVNKEIKERAEQLFDSIGLSMSTAINVFLRKSLDENGVPFALTTKQTGFGAGHSAEEITKAFNDALQKDSTHSREDGCLLCVITQTLKKRTLNTRMASGNTHDKCVRKTSGITCVRRAKRVWKISTRH